MASMDRLEGDFVEGVIALALIFLTVVILLAYFNLRNFDPSSILQQALSGISKALQKWWANVYSPVTIGTGGGGLIPLGDYLNAESGSSEQVQTGTDWGVE